MIEDEYGYPKQPTKEVIYILMGDKCKCNGNDSPDALLWNMFVHPTHVVDARKHWKGM